MASAIVPSKGPAQSRRERHMFALSDDNAMMKQVRATHSLDGLEFSVKPLLQIVEDVFNRANLSITSIVQGAHQAQMGLDAVEEKIQQNGFHELLDLLSLTINKIGCEMSCKCSGGGDAHATTLAIFNVVSSYTWDAKVVLALAAFAVNYGEFWLVGQLYLTNPLAKAVAFLKQYPDILEQSEVLQHKFDALNNLIKAMMEVANCIVELKELPSQYITPDMPEILTATAVYWTIRSTVACAAQIIGLIGMGHDYTASTTKEWELSSLAHKVSNIYSHLMKQLTVCSQHMDKKTYVEAYPNLVRLFEMIHIDNMKILRALIYSKDDQLPLFDGSTKKRASLDVLKRKNVLLFISDLELSYEELSILQQTYVESRGNQTRTESHYEVVWIPVVDQSNPWDEIKQKNFDALQLEMPWYSVYHPSLLEMAVIKYIKEAWHFKKKPLLVVLDPQGKVVNPNAIHMMWIWGSHAFPFTSTREEALWKDEVWRIDLLADTIDPIMVSWINDGKFICLYGGEDIKWIRKFTTAAKEVGKKAQIQLEMLYVGTSNPREKVRRNNNIILSENLSDVLPDLTLIWFFWVRLESMWHSKVQNNRTVENDPIMRDIMTMLSFDGSEKEWAVVSRGSYEMAKAKGDTILNSFLGFESWKKQAEEKGFIPAMNDKLHELHTALHCNRLILPEMTGSIPQRVVCTECGRGMEKFIMYRCCTD